MNTVSHVAAVCTESAFEIAEIATARRRPPIVRRMRAAAFLLGGWIVRIVTCDDASLSWPPLGSRDWDLLEEDLKRQVVHAARIVPLILMSLICVGWCAGLLLLHKEPAEQAIFTSWRLAMLTVFGVMYVTFSRVGAARRRPALAAAPFAFAAASGAAYFVGRLGGVVLPVCFRLSAARNIPVAVPGPILARLGLLLAVAGGLVVGFFGPNPGYLRSPLLGEALIFLVLELVGSAIAGHFAYIRVCERFFQKLALARTALELETLNGALVARVREKTVELARLAEHLQIVQEEERGRIARELHDELGQRLSAMRFVLATTRRRVARSPAAISPGLRELDTMLDGTLECSRTIVSGLRPPVLDQLGLAAAIEWLARRMGAQAGIDCALDLSGDDAVSPVIALAAYRVLQESLTNVTRHSGARRVAVRLRVSPGLLVLEVTDDGRGFPGEGADHPRDRNGLLGMRERAFALGGELVTGNVPTGGARVRLCLPLSAPASEVST